MGGDTPPLTGPDFTEGVELTEVPAGGMLLGHAGEEAVLLVRPGTAEEVFAVSASCTHYHGPLGNF
jgi:nitrite reductase/ring-hydroxylating ferredoxin subunit